MKLEPHMLQSLERLAASSIGRQGIGFVRSAKIAMHLFQVGVARPVKNGERNLCAVTLDGFRFLEAQRQKKPEGA